MSREPLSRIEKILSNIVGEGSYELDPPMSDAEEILQAILNDSSIDTVARDRICTILLCILNNEEYTGKTLSRSEEILKVISQGEKYEVDEWIYEHDFSRVEQLLTDWANKEDPEYIKTVTGTIINVLDAVAKDAISLKVAMEPTQEATPFVGETTTEPYLSKTASTTGNKRYLDKIVGGTVAWNQLAELDSSIWGTRSTTITFNQNNGFDIKSSSSGNVYRGVGISKASGVIQQNHVFFISAIAYTSYDDGIVRLGIKNNTTHYNYEDFLVTVSTTGTTPKLLQCIGKTSSSYPYVSIGIRTNQPTSETAYIENLQIIDLTLMFGSTIADYIYSLETSEAGSGIAWLKSYGFIDGTYRAYNAGELISCRPEGIQYGSTTHAFGSAVDLRGLYRLDANNKLYCDGDELTPDGTLTARYGIADLGDLTYAYSTTYRTGGYFVANIVDSKRYSYVISSKYASGGIISNQSQLADIPNKTILKSTLPNFQQRIYIIDEDYTDGTALATALAGQKIVYELDTPTTSTAETYPNPVDIENGDTEAFIDTRSIPLPVGNNSHYAGEYSIEGKSSVNVHHSNDNMFDANDLQKWKSTTDITITVNDTTSFNLKASNVNYASTKLSTITQINSGDSFILKFKMKVNSSTSSGITIGFRNTNTDQMIGNNSAISVRSDSFVIDEWVEYSKLIYLTDNLNASLSILITWNNKPSTNIDFKDFELIKAQNTYSVSFTSQGTVYGGTMDIVSGALSIKWAEIASYAGEILPGRWLSSKDEYVEGTTPTTGAQVVYELAEPITYQLSPTQVTMLLGENTLWTEDGEITLTYTGTNPAMMMQSLRVQNNILKKQGLTPIEPLKPLDPVRPILKK